MFSAFGSLINDDLETGLIETFQSGTHEDRTDECYMENGRIMCSTGGASRTTQSTSSDGTNDPQTKPAVIRASYNPAVTEQFQNGTRPVTESSSSDSETSDSSDPEIEEANEDEARQRRVDSSNSTLREFEERQQARRPTTTPATMVTDEPDETSQVLDEPDETSQVLDEPEETGPTITEQFTNMNGDIVKRATSSNLLLKAVLFSCVFYILTHSDTRNFIMNKVLKSVKWIKSEHYEYIGVLLFFLLFYIISIFL